MFVHDTYKRSPDVTGMSPENVESSSSQQAKTERNSPKTISSNVSEPSQFFDKFKQLIICYNWRILL